MQDYLISADKKTPEVKLLTSGELLIAGCSLPENVVQFYAPVFSWLEEFRKISPAGISLTLDFEYLSSSSAKIILDILKVSESILPDKADFRIVWKYDKEDTDMLDMGGLLEKNLKHKFEFVEKA